MYIRNIDNVLHSIIRTSKYHIQCMYLLYAVYNVFTSQIRHQFYIAYHVYNLFYV